MQKKFKNKKILVMGLGLHGGGVSAAKFFCKQGAEVLVTDLKTEAQLEDSLKKLKKLNIKYTLGGHKEDDFVNADLIIKNPDVPATSPYLEIARVNKIPIKTDVELFFEMSEAFTIGVTGSKGKSTTASLIYHILNKKYKRVFLAGNIGKSPLEILEKVRKGDKVVLELSSFELDDLKQSPNIAVVTNILPDHLNRYGTMQNYIESKKIIFKYQKSSDFLVLNKDDAMAKSFASEAKSKVYYFSGATPKEQNVSAATAVAKLLEIPETVIEKAIKSFKGVPHRQEFVKEINGVKYFNDTTATMPNAVIAAIENFSSQFANAKIILIAGGQDKNLDYKDLSVVIKNKVCKLVLLPGTASEKIKKELADWPEIVKVSSMQEAVEQARGLAQKNDVVVLSPGAASFNLFKNEFDRGNQFVKFVKEIKK